ncbi:hypothetical protein N8Z54_05235 [Octadecabacter sp.]|nr:hypothetical protein [Octadecabacter sp.]
MIRDMIKADHLPDYEMVEEEGYLIRFSARTFVIEDGVQLPPLSGEGLDAARMLAPGLDVYVLEADWRAFGMRSSKPRLRSADAAFVKARSAQ